MSCHPVLGAQEGQVRPLPDGQHAAVGRDGDDVLVVVGRREAPGRVEDLRHAPELDRLEAGGPRERFGPRRGWKWMPSFFASSNSSWPCAVRRSRHLLEALQRDDGHLGGTATHRRARGVERLHQAGVGLGPEGGAERGHVLLAPDPQRGPGGVEGDEPAANQTTRRPRSIR